MVIKTRRQFLWGLVKGKGRTLHPGEKLTLYDDLDGSKKVLRVHDETTVHVSETTHVSSNGWRGWETETLYGDQIRGKEVDSDFFGDGLLLGYKRKVWYEPKEGPARRR